MSEITPIDRLLHSMDDSYREGIVPIVQIEQVKQLFASLTAQVEAVEAECAKHIYEHCGMSQREEDQKRMAKGILAALEEAKKDDPRDWPEDFSHENGNYHNKCCECGQSFLGHKRRVVCKVCAAKEVI